MPEFPYSEYTVLVDIKLLFVPVGAAGEEQRASFSSDVYLIIWIVSAEPIRVARIF